MCSIITRSVSVCHTTHILTYLKSSCCVLAGSSRVYSVNHFLQFTQLHSVKSCIDLHFVLVLRSTTFGWKHISLVSLSKTSSQHPQALSTQEYKGFKLCFGGGDHLSVICCRLIQMVSTPTRDIPNKRKCQTTMCNAKSADWLYEA